MVNFLAKTKPFKHFILDGFLSIKELKRINDEWPQDGWEKEDGKYQRKWNRTETTPAAKEIVEWIDPLWVSELFDIEGLFLDPDLVGGGLHCTPPGGFLDMHCDFQTHPKRKHWRRRVNVLIYLNEVWDPEWGGALRLGLEDPVEILPVGGRAVLFETTEETWHGHPKPLVCPDFIQRRSLALYFYTKEETKDRRNQKTDYWDPRKR
jgi:Rps23 Pro-64 3,4-dihydroxylase Tpa1-like proline 4-hydroxylase